MNAPEWFNTLLNMSAQAALLCALVFLLTKACARWIPASWRAALWFLVVVRLLIPIAPPSRLSLQNFWISPKPVSQAAPEPTFKLEIQDLAMPPVESAPQLTESLPEPIIRQPKPVRPWTMFGIIWGIGGTVSLAVLAARTILLRRRLRSCESSNLLREQLDACRAQIGLRFPLRISASRAVASPALTGLFPARLIVPESFEQFSPEQIRRILLHELAHIKQGHLIFHWLTLVARCVHWFNPIIHFAAVRLRQECELAADAAALRDATEPERIAYGETILKVLAQTNAPSSVLALSMAEQTRHLEQRLRALAGPNRPGCRTLGLLAALMLGIAGLSGADVSTPPKPEQPLAPATNSLATTTTVTRLKRVTPLDESRKLILSGRLSEAEALLQKAISSESLHTPRIYEFETITTIENPVPTNLVSVKTNAIFGPPTKPSSDSQLITRTFRVDPELFRRSPDGKVFFEPARDKRNPDEIEFDGGVARLSRQTKDSPLIIDKIRNFFAQAGVQFETNSLAIDWQMATGAILVTNTTPTRKTMYYNESHGILYVRATQKDLETIEQRLHSLKIEQALHSLVLPPPRFSIRLRVAEMPESVATGIFGAHFPTNQTFSAQTNASFALSAKATEALIAELKQKESVDLLTAPVVRSVSGRQVRLGIEETLWRGEATVHGALEPTVDVAAYAGVSNVIQMSTVVTLSTYMGLQKDEDSTNATPTYRVRQAVFPQTLTPGDSQVIYLPHGARNSAAVVLGDIPMLGRLFRSQSSTNSKDAAIIVISPTLVGPDGKAVPAGK